MLQLIIKHCSYFLYFIIFQSIVFANNADNIETWISADDLNNIKILEKLIKDIINNPKFSKKYNDTMFIFKLNKNKDIKDQFFILYNIYEKEIATYIINIINLAF